jgi:Flp pilus assembly protein TadD
MQETRRLRRQLATSHLERAVSIGSRGRFDLAQRLAEQAVDLDPEVPQAHVILAKIRFWSGDIDGASASIERAEQAGLTPSAAAPLREAIDTLRWRERQRREAAERQAKTLKGWAAQLAFAGGEVRAWATEERWTVLVYLACLLLILGIAGHR